MNRPSIYKAYRKNVPIELVITLWEAGMDTAEIAARTGCHESAIYNILAEWRESKNDPHSPAIPAKCEPPLESD